MRFVLRIVVHPFLLYLRALRRIGELSENTEATKTIFEFFRNLATALALVATGMWLTTHPDTGNYLHTILREVCGSCILLVGGALHLLLLINAAKRLTDAGIPRRGATTLVIASIFLGILGVADYLAFK